MQPSFELRIQTMVKAMRETIMPALDPANSAAIEQAYIVMGSLELLRQQIDHAHPFEVADARGMAELVRAMTCEASLPSGEAADAVAARALLAVEDRDSPLSALRECNRALRAAIGLLIADAFADDDVSSRIQTLVLNHSERQIDRERAFVAAANFDVFPNSLRTIKETLSRAS